MRTKRILAAVMALCMMTGAIGCGAPAIAQSITAQADSAVEAECYSFDEATGTLTLRGKVDRNAISTISYKSSIKSIIAEEGTVLPEDCYELFFQFEYCTSIDLLNADASNVTNMCSMFRQCTSLTSLDLSSFDTSNVTNMRSMFEKCTSLTSLDLSSFDTSNVTYMGSMFRQCTSLTSLDLSSFDTSNVTNMRSMFENCTSLTSLDLSSFDTSKVTDMLAMFAGCSALTSLDLSSFDTSKVTDMVIMFEDCSSLTSLDLSSFDTSNVTNMDCMFRGCSTMTSLDLSSFDTSNVTNMGIMFGYCNNLTSIDLSSFDTSNVTDMSWMFNGCTSLNSFTLGENFKSIPEDAKLPNGKGWVNAARPAAVVSGSGEFAVIENKGTNTYKQYTAVTYPTNIKVEYSEKYHQVRLTWDEVEGADRYGIAVYLAGKWRIQTQSLTTNSYTTPKNLTPGKSYKIAVAARVNGSWDIAGAVKNSVTVTVK